jgi:hypothetical protein
MRAVLPFTKINAISQQRNLLCPEKLCLFGSAARISPLMSEGVSQRGAFCQESAALASEFFPFGA